MNIFSTDNLINNKSSINRQQEQNISFSLVQQVHKYFSSKHKINKFFVKITDLIDTNQPFFNN